MEGPLLNEAQSADGMLSNSSTSQANGVRHDVFISYSRKDTEFAAKLEKALKSYKPPKNLSVPQRFLKVFRDESDLRGVEYNSAIESHLGASAKLVLVCSPSAKASPFVNDEIQRFARLRGSENIIPVLVSGVPNNEAKPGQEAEQAFPAALCALQEIPLATSDYRGRLVGSGNRVDRGACEAAWYALLANIYDKDRSEIEQREKRRHAKRRNLVVSGLSTIVAILGVALFVTVQSRQEAVRQRGIAEQRQREAEAARDRADQAAAAEKVAREEEAVQRARAEQEEMEAKRQRDVAEQQRQKAVARQLAVQADLLAEQQTHRLPTSILLYVESLNRLKAPETAEKLSTRLPLLPRCPLSFQTHAAVNAVTFSADGDWVVSGGADGTVIVWQVSDGKQLFRVRREDGWSIQALALDRKKQLLAVRASNVQARGENVSVWRLSEGREELRTPLFFNHETPLAFTQDGAGILIDTRAGLRGYALSRWDVGQGTETVLMQLEPEAGFGKPHFGISPDGSIVAGVEGMTVWIQDLKTNQPRRSITSGNPIDLMAFSNDGDSLVTVSGGWARLWEIARPNKVAQFFGDGKALQPPSTAKTLFVGDARAVAYDSHHDRLAALSNGVVRVWDLTKGSEVQRISRVGAVSAFAFHPKGSHFAVGGTDGTIALCTDPSNVSKQRPIGIAATRRTVLLLEGVGANRALLRDSADGRGIGEVAHGEKIRALAIDADARQLAISGDKSLVVWNLAKKSTITRKEAGLFLGLAFDPTGSKLAAANYRNVEIVDLKSGATVASFAYSDQGRVSHWGLPGDEAANAPTDGIELAFSADGAYLQIGKFSEPGARLWNIATKQQVLQVRGDKMLVNPVGPHVVTLEGQEMIVRNINHQQILRSKVSSSSLDRSTFAASRSADLIATRDGPRVEVRETRRGKKLLELNVDREDCASTAALAFDSAGKHLAIVCHRKNNTALVRIWEIASGGLVARVSHDGFVSSLIFSFDDRLVVLSDRDKPRAWHWRAEELVRQACLRVGQNIDAADWKRYLPEEAYRKSC